MQAERFWGYVDAGDCWEWTAAKNQWGYGVAWIGGRAGRSYLAHRWAWLTLVGPIPAGKQLDHLCRNRACVNPDHLEPVAARTNSLRGYGPQAVRARRAHCKRGHEWTETNTRWYRGYRMCRACNRENLRRRRDYLERVEGPDDAA